MLLQTHLLERIAQQNIRVTLLTPDLHDENLQKLSAHPNIELAQWDEKYSLWDDDYLHRRMYYLEDVDANTALKEKVINGLLYSDSMHPWKRVRPVFYYVVYKLLKWFPSIRKRFISRERQHLTSSLAESLMKSLKPDLVISTYPVNVLDAKILFASQQRDIPTVLHLLSWDNVACKGRFPVVPDQFMVWGEVMKNEIKDVYQPLSSSIYVVGVPHFDLHHTIRLGQNAHPGSADLKSNSGRSYLFFGMSSPRFAPREIDIVEWLAHQIEEGKFGDDVHLVVRPHPQNMTSHLADASLLDRLKVIESSKVVIDYPRLNQSKIKWSLQQEDMEGLAKLMSEASICLNSGSTISIEALHYDLPVILTSFDGKVKLPYWKSARRLIDYPHLKAFITAGGAVAVSNYDQLEEQIHRYLEAPNEDLQLRRHVREEYCYLFDGKATDRVVETVNKMLVSRQSMMISNT